jgi:hypothetical protein
MHERAGAATVNRQRYTEKIFLIRPAFCGLQTGSPLDERTGDMRVFLAPFCAVLVGYPSPALASEHKFKVKTEGGHQVDHIYISPISAARWDPISSARTRCFHRVTG